MLGFLTQWGKMSSEVSLRCTLVTIVGLLLSMLACSLSMPNVERTIDAIVAATLSAIPTNTPAPIDVTVEVLADRGWQDSDVEAREGQQLEVEYVSGKWTNWAGHTPPFDARGENSVCTMASCCEPSPDDPKGALIGKVGKEIFLIGNGGAFTPNAGGNLLLRMNDCDASAADNAGSVVVRIRR
jgi:hypothetical protein